ncbi:MAG TPA: carboxypeptidase-like regulatory domain-containing protein [Saprospiraceae bacterium]|nr:carboxypeptidase-like regulatory domain-containing protein [Saprospiraceae bacterium]
MSNIRILPLLALLLFGCRKNELIDKVTIDDKPPVVLVVSSFKGKVLDEDGQPLAGAIVRVFNESTVTNQNGLFEFKNIEAPKDAALVSVEKDGYFTGSAMSGNRSGGQQYVRVTMMQKGAPQTVNAAAGGTLAWPDGLKVKIAPNTLLRANGSVYSGEADVYARRLDPTDPELGAIMPGALMARDEEGNEKVLATYGMVALELKGASGEDLVLKAGETAEVEIPIPDQLAASAPQEIPLWYFDLEEERWLLKGVCNKSGSGSAYICKVGSGGYWNCDIPLEPICLSGTFFQSDSTPALYTKVIVEDLTDNFIYWGYTDLDGFFCGSVPKGAPLKITVKDLCNNILYEANIGPFSVDTDLGDIYLTQTLQQYFIHIAGQLNDCAGAPVVEGQIAVQYPGKIRLFPLSAPGAFGFDLALNCIEFPELQITGYDLTTFKATPVQFHSDDSDADLGVLTACEDPGDYIHLIADGVPYNAAPTRFYLKNNVTTNWMVLEGLTTGGTFSIEMRDYTGAGSYIVNAFFHLNDLPDAPNYPVLNAASPDITVIITTDDGQFISGTITGTAYDAINNPHTVSGDFKVKKEL